MGRDLSSGTFECYRAGVSADPYDGSRKSRARAAIPSQPRL